MPQASAALVTAPSPPRVAGLRLALERLSVLGILVHAVFLPISVAGMQIGLAVSLGALLALRFSGRRVWARSALDAPCVLLSAAAIVSLGLGALAGSPPVGWHEATLWRAILTPILVVSALEVVGGGPGGEREGAARRVAIWALALWAASSLVPSTIAWVQYWTGFDPLHALGLRAEAVRGVVPIYPDRYAAVGFFRWYQRLAHNLIPPICVAAAVAVYGHVSARLRVLLAIAAAAGAAAVVFTLSRAAWVSLIAAGLLLAIVGGRARRWSIAGVVLASFAMLLHPGVQARLRYLVTVRSANDDRKAIWTVCRAVIADHPITGVGWGNLPRRSLAYYDRLAPWSEMRAWCHDSFLSAWAEGGPLLFAALVAFWLLLLRAFWGKARAGDATGRAASAGAVAALTAMLMNSLVHDILYSSEAMYGLGFALGIAAVLGRLTERGVASGTR